jgi:DNA invertase Pin-like site-specific DNA recombinase
MLIGYARVSTEDQDLTLQRAALKGAGCQRIYEEKISGAKRARPELNRLLDHLRAGRCGRRFQARPTGPLDAGSLGHCRTVKNR